MSRLPRKQAISVAEALREMFRSERLGATLNTRRVFVAWEEASGAGDFTIRKFFRDGVLYVTLSSSVLASQLSMQKAALLEKMNAILAGDPLLIREDEHEQIVKELRIK